MTVLLVGANPGIRLFDGENPTAFVSLWQVDWSARGAGRALILGYDDRVRVLTDDAPLGSWLEEHFTRHFPETDGLLWSDPEVEVADVDLRIDLATGARCRSGDVEVELTEPMDRRAASTDKFFLDGVAHSLQMVVAPARRGSIIVGGTPVPGDVRVTGSEDRPSSSAFVSVAEAWSGPE